MVAITECFTASRNGARHVAQIFPSLSRFRPGDPTWPHRNATVLVALVAGRRKLKSPAFTAVRAELQRQCDGHRDCRHLELVDRGGFNAIINAVGTLYASARYCLQPPGDNPTRKGIFDSLGLGCIPVVFDDRSLAVFTMHIPDPTAVSIYVPPAGVLDGTTDVMATLRAIPASRVKELRSAGSSFFFVYIFIFIWRGDEVMPDTEGCQVVAAVVVGDFVGRRWTRSPAWRHRRTGQIRNKLPTSLAAVLLYRAIPLCLTPPLSACVPECRKPDWGVLGSCC